MIDRGVVAALAGSSMTCADYTPVCTPMQRLAATRSVAFHGALEKYTGSKQTGLMSRANACGPER